MAAVLITRVVTICTKDYRCQGNYRVKINRIVT